MLIPYGRHSANSPTTCRSSRRCVARPARPPPSSNELGLSDDSKVHIRIKTLLTDPAEENVPALVELVKERLEEGHGEALFDVGLEDNGDSMGFSKETWEFALERMGAVCEELKADYKILMTRNVGGDVEVGPRDAKETGASGKMLLRQRPESVDNVIETRIAVVGNVDAGKSTMLGVLVKGGLDDGRGKARVNLFRHKHEIESGRTSSVGMEIMGLDHCWTKADMGGNRTPICKTRVLPSSANTDLRRRK
jgi:GTPase